MVVFAIHSHESAMGVLVSPILTLPPTSLLIPSLRVIPVHHPEHPVSCIKPGLVIPFTYDNIHVSMLFSQIIPPLPFPTESKRLFYTSVSLLLSRIHWRRKWQPTPGFLPGESQGRGAWWAAVYGVTQSQT